MAEQLPTEEYNQEAVDAFANAGKPIPGQSLTASPDEIRPFEGPPEFTNFREALNYVAEELLEEEAYLNLVASIADGVPIIDMAMQIGYVGFREGKWNPDLMVMLIEPLMYLLMALCEKAGVEYRIDDEDDDDDDDEATILQEKSENIARVAKAKMAKTGVIPKGALTKEIETKLETLEVPQQGLLDRPEPSPEPQSLLNRGQ